MKLCKDCKHAVMPHPLAQLAQYGQAAPVHQPMCGHPKASRSVVDGSLETMCVEARGSYPFGATEKSICWPDAELFEQALPPPQPEMRPYALIPVETERDKSFWEKAKHWFM